MKLKPIKVNLGGTAAAGSLKIEPIKVNLGGAATPGFFSFCGRARRREFWVRIVQALLFALLFSVPSSVLVGMFTMDDDMILMIASLLGFGWWLVFFLPVTVRRLHDINMSGWCFLWLWLLSLIPFVGWIVSIVSFVIIGFLGGNVGPNKFGADPKAEEHAALLQGRVNAAQTSNDGVPHGAQLYSGIQGEVSVRLKKLQELRAQGLISDTEYEEKRSKVLETI